MVLKKIKFGDKEVNKKDFYLLKQAIPLDSVDLNKIVVSNKLKINETTWKYLCGYLNNDVVQPLCVILPQMSGCIKYFDNDNKNMSFVTEDENVHNKYNETWEVIRKLLKVKYASDPIRDGKYIVAKLKIFNKVNKTIFNNHTLSTVKKRDHNSIPLEKHTYNCITAINIDSILKINKAKPRSLERTSETETNNIKKAYPQAYLEQCKYQLKKEEVVYFIDDEIIDADDDDDDDDDNDINDAVDSYVQI